MRIRQKEIRKARKRLEERIKATVKSVRKPAAPPPPAPKPRTRRKVATPAPAAEAQAE